MNDPGDEHTPIDPRLELTFAVRRLAAADEAGDNAAVETEAWAIARVATTIANEARSRRA